MAGWPASLASCALAGARLPVATDGAGGCLLAGWLAFFLVRVAGVALALVSGCLSCPPGAVLVAVSASLISTAARRHAQTQQQEEEEAARAARGPARCGPRSL
jgi:hypothetical protein